MTNLIPHAPCFHLVTLNCKDAENAGKCLAALRNYGRPDAISYGCVSYDFGLKIGHDTVIQIVERWSDWADLDKLLDEKVVPALPMYNELLDAPFNPASHTMRVNLD
jgi:hypothetical protein